jgi:hypothetical protein
MRLIDRIARQTWCRVPFLQGKWIEWNVRRSIARLIKSGKLVSNGDGTYSAAKDGVRTFDALRKADRGGGTSC